MSSVPRWWKRTVTVTLVLLAIDSAVFTWVWLPDRPASNYEEYLLGTGVLSGILGLVLIAAILGLFAFRWLTRSPPSSSP